MVRKPMIGGLVVVVGAVVGLALAVLMGTWGQNRSPRTDHIFTKAAVATDVRTCSHVGRDILKRNGSAVDAAIASLLCVSLFNSHSSGIGGGLYFIIYNASTGKVETIDSRETAPSKASVNMFSENGTGRTGGLTIAIPGELRGYKLAHERHGRLPWKDLFQPAIALARQGVPVGKPLALAIFNNKEAILANQHLRDIFCDSNKNILKENDIVRYPKLADTLQRIAEEGPDVFYDGALTKTMVKDIQDAGGIVTLEDFSGYEPVLNENPLKVNVADYTMFVPGAPSGGPVLALILNILNGYKFSSKSVSTTEQKILTYHRIVEAFRFAFAKRSKIGDPRYVNITELISNITSDYFGESIRSKITDDTTHPITYYEPDYCSIDNNGTTHLSILAEDGSAVAVTSSINLYFGSQVVSPSTGVIFNDQMFDFSSPYLNGVLRQPQTPNNYIQPGKRPMSAMCPTIIFDRRNRVKMVLGASGGNKIISATALVILNSLSFNYDLKRALREPRIHNQLKPNSTKVEPEFDKLVLEGLAQKNHNTTVVMLTTPHSVIQAVLRQGDLLHAECDPRKGGHPAGY